MKSGDFFLLDIKEPEKRQISNEYLNSRALKNEPENASGFESISGERAANEPGRGHRSASGQVRDSDLRIFYNILPLNVKIFTVRVIFCFFKFSTILSSLEIK